MSVIALTCAVTVASIRSVMNVARLYRFRRVVTRRSIVDLRFRCRSLRLESRASSSEKAVSSCCSWPWEYEVLQCYSVHADSHTRAEVSIPCPYVFVLPSLEPTDAL